jgi:uncharacterized heparinase superfamily protein
MSIEEAMRRLDLIPAATPAMWADAAECLRNLAPELAEMVLGKGGVS